MLLKKLEPLTVFEIWEPLYSRKAVLLKASKVKGAKTKYLKILFTKAPSMEGDWIISKVRAMGHSKASNGTTQCYEIPLSELEVLEIDQKDIRMLI